MNQHTAPDSTFNRYADPIDRDLARVNHDTAAVQSLQPNLVVRTARRTWAQMVRSWRVQDELHSRRLHLPSY